jgi:hypothetical protein
MPTLAGLTRVVHCRREPYDVYIGRPGPWGNPFVLGRDGNRELVIEKYRAYLRERLAHEPGLRERIVRELGGGTVLGCWCAPRPCHGHPLARVANGGEP